MIINKEKILICPVCGCEYTHFIKEEKYKEKDGRECIKLLFLCEDGHNFYVDFHQHEGFTIIDDETFNHRNNFNEK